MNDHLTSRAQRLIEGFEEGQDVRHGIAKVLMHLVHAWGDPESWYGVTASTLTQLAEELTAPSLLNRALLGDSTAARQFLYEAGFTDEHGQLKYPYRPEDLNDD